MIYINLLPWREAKYNEQRTKFFTQLFCSLVLASIISALIWVKNIHQIEGQQAQLQTIKATNKQLFSRLEKFQSARSLYLKQQQQVVQINKLIARRQVVPNLLALLGNKRLSFKVDYVSVNNQGIKIKGQDTSSTSPLALLNTLREESAFCQVVFTPFDNKQSISSVQFELQAELCDG